MIKNFPYVTTKRICSLFCEENSESRTIIFPKISLAMDTKLINEAAREGNVEKLKNLLENDHFSLRAIALANGDTPLHIACFEGHVDFAKEILARRPVFAMELNKDGFTPLHIASASGDAEIVRELLRVGGCSLCLVKGRERRIPLHYAVARGRIGIVQELLSACPNSVAEVSSRGESCFHVAVKSSQFEAFEVLVEHVGMYGKEDVLNYEDEQGNTVLHLAAFRKQYEVFDLLIKKNFGQNGKLNVNPSNKNGLTPLDTLASAGGDTEIHAMLLNLTASAADEENVLPALQSPSCSRSRQEQSQGECTSKSSSKILQEYFKYDNIKNSPSKVRNTLLVISVLIVTATYQAVLSPPGGVWQDDYWPDTNNVTSTNDSGKDRPRSAGHRAGQAVMSTHNSISYGIFLLFNSLGFFMSLHMMNFLTYELPLQFELRVALFALTITYSTCMIEITSNSTVWLAFVVFAIVMPLMMPVLTKVVRDYKEVLLPYAFRRFLVILTN